MYVFAKKDAVKLNDIVRLELNGRSFIWGLVIHVDCIDDHWDGVRIHIPLTLQNMKYETSSLRCYVCESMTSCFRELEALYSLSTSSFLPYILNQNKGDGGKERVWSESFMNIIKKNMTLNESQMNALKDSVNTEKKFCLIQGPFGTGKTKTIVSILNCVYMKQYEKFYLDLILGNTSSTRPKILVSAPSNVAIDIIVSRVLSTPFYQKDGNIKNKKPRIVRSGNGTTEIITETSVSLSSRIDKYINIPESHLNDEIMKLNMLIDTKKSEIALITTQLKLFIDSIGKYKIPKPWEARLDDEMMVYFYNPIDQRIQYDIDMDEPDTCSYGTLDEFPEYINLKIKLCTCVDFVYDLTNELNRFQIVLNENSEKRKRILIEKDIINTSDIVFTTLNSCSLLDSKTKFSFSIIDESCQATEISILVALQKVSGKCILVGDPQQLPPTVKSKKLKVLGISLFERLTNEGYPYHFLNEQYRMHPLISYFPRMTFYNGNLHDGIKDPTYFHQKYYDIPIFNAFSFIDLSSSICERNGTSYVNPMEAECIFNMYITLLHVTGQNLDDRVAIITPYKKQVDYLKVLFKGFKIEINTIDSFQGGEKEIVFFSCVRTSKDIGFLKDKRRLNVALTRAKCGLYIVGNQFALENNTIWYNLIEFSKRHGRYFNINEMNMAMEKVKLRNKRKFEEYE
jgi:senataxin